MIAQRAAVNGVVVKCGNAGEYMLQGPFAGGLERSVFVLCIQRGPGSTSRCLRDAPCCSWMCCELPCWRHRLRIARRYARQQDVSVGVAVSTVAASSEAPGASPHVHLACMNPRAIFQRRVMPTQERRPWHQWRERYACRQVPLLDRLEPHAHLNVNAPGAHA